MPPAEPQQIEDPFAERPQPTGIALLRAGFRPFFLFAMAFGALSVPVWIGVLDGADRLSLANPKLWHGHEMLFGYTAAAIAGFFMTVVPNWTRAKPQRGPVLALLAGLWILGRVAYWAQAWLDPWIVAAADLSFLVLLFALVVRPLVDPQHRRQAQFLPILLAMIAGNALIHAEHSGLGAFGETGLRLCLDAVLVLITIMGGRVTPSFTTNWMGPQIARDIIHIRPMVERTVLWLMWALLALDLAFADTAITGAVALLAGLAQLVRLQGWAGWKTMSAPIVWVLHVGYLWLVIGLVLKGLAGFGLFGAADADHALTIGAIGVMTIAIMTRATLGHTGRVIHAHPLTVAAYGLVNAAALLRLSFGFSPDIGWLQASGAAWTLGFVCLLIVYAPMLLRPRIDGKMG